MTVVDPSPVGRPRLDRLAVIAGIVVTLVLAAVVAMVAAANSPARTGANPPTGGSAAGGNHLTAADASPDPSASPGSGTDKDHGWLGGPGFPGRGHFEGPGGFRGLVSISITSIDGTKISLKTDNGWARTIDTTGVIITRSGTTITATDLAAGDQVWLDEQRNTDGTWTVKAITVVLPQVHGTVTDVSGQGFTVTLRDGSTQVVDVNGSTTYLLGDAAATKSAVKKGAMVEAEGTKSGTTFTATRVRVHPAVVGGSITEKSASSITVQQRDGSTATIHVSDATTYHVAGSDTAALADVKVGDMVIAQGALRDDGSLDATDLYAGFRGFHDGRGGPGRGGPGWPGGGPGWKGGGPDDDGTAPEASPSPAGASTNG